MSTRLYIGHLPPSANEKDLEGFFRNFGRLNDIALKQGYGFVEFDNRRDARDALEQMNGKQLCGESISLEFARDGGSRRGQSPQRRARPSSGMRYPPPNRYDDPRNRRSRPFVMPKRTDYRVIVRNLSSRTTWQNLKDFMRKAGNVSYCDVHTYRRGEGVVDFIHGKDMEYALKNLSGRELNGHEIYLEEDIKKSSHSRSASSSRSASRSATPEYKNSNRYRRPRSRSKSLRYSDNDESMYRIENNYNRSVSPVHDKQHSEDRHSMGKNDVESSDKNDRFNNNVGVE
ncbi:hypothetical protein SNEBB_000885 [Seison nebaliae]|nr:hypothetical protein SNEBB_000885 [Seison nebaliae]